MLFLNNFTAYKNKYSILEDLFSEIMFDSYVMIHKQ